MWGSDARLCSAYPLLSRYGPSCPYVTPASTVTVRALASSSIPRIGFSDKKLESLSAIELKQCRVPSTFNLLSERKIDCACSIDEASSRRSVPYTILPAQLVSLWFAFSMEMGLSKEPAMALENNCRKVRLSIKRLQIVSDLSRTLSEPPTDSTAGY